MKKDPVTLDAFNKLVIKVCADPEVLKSLSVLVSKVGAEDTIGAATATLLTSATHTVMNDPDILNHSKDFVSDVVTDDVIQKTSGDALWNTITYSVTPGVVSLLAGVGVSFLGVGLLALSKGGKMDDVDFVKLYDTVSNFIVAAASKATSIWWWRGNDSKGKG